MRGMCSLFLAVSVGFAGTARGAVILSDNFDPINNANWSNLSNATAAGSGQPGFLSGNALWFNGNGTRSATTVPLNVSSGGTISFAFRGGNEGVDGSTWWENSEGSSEWADLFYSTDGVTFTPLQALNTQGDIGENPTVWNNFVIAIPLAAQSATTRFRWEQRGHSGNGFDHWAIDNLQVSTPDNQVIPEPGSLLIFGVCGLTLVACQRRRRWRRANAEIG